MRSLRNLLRGGVFASEDAGGRSHVTPRPWMRRLATSAVAVVASGAMLVSGAYAAPSDGVTPATSGDQMIQQGQATQSGDSSTNNGSTGSGSDGGNGGTSSGESGDSSSGNGSGVNGDTGDNNGDNGTVGNNGNGDGDGAAGIGTGDASNGTGNGGTSDSGQSSDTDSDLSKPEQSDTADSTQSQGGAETASANNQTSRITDDELAAHTVPGVSPRGTTINLFDYWVADERGAADNSSGNPDTGINQGHVLHFGSGLSGGNGNANEWTKTAEPRTGLVQNQLRDGYPALSSGIDTNTESLDYLFSPTKDHDGKQSFSDVKGLLQVDKDGYYYYNSQQNFAQFNEGDNKNDFTLYDAWGVNADGASPNGQFFPFDSGKEVFSGVSESKLQQQNIGSKNPSLNHFFGMTMSTDFVQQNDGYADTDKTMPVTYNFSGDDDVWIFIDGVLVGDLGGIHDATSLQIDFSTGDVIVFDDATQKTGGNPNKPKPNTEAPNNLNNRYDKGETTYLDGKQDTSDNPLKTTLKALFEKVGADTSGFSENTFADDTYHSLDFFYLERGHTDSNMSLKYNLVTIPQTDIVKVDQEGNPLQGVTFTGAIADENWSISTDTEDTDPVFTATTDSNGRVVLMDNTTKALITYDKLWEEYETPYAYECADGGKRINLILTEIKPLPGYRSPTDMHLYLWHVDSQPGVREDAVTVLLSDNMWETGAYSDPSVLITTPSELSGVRIDDQATTIQGKVGELLNEDSGQGHLYALIEQKNEQNEWHLVYGSHDRGWRVSKEPQDSITAIQTAISDSEAAPRFLIGTAGAYETTVGSLPGRLQDYVFFKGEQGSYRGVYYYTTADRPNEMMSSNTYRITDTSGFVRRFSAHLYVPNILNRVIVQKVNQNQKNEPVNGVEFALYAENSIKIEKDGTYQILDNAQPVKTDTTRTLTLGADKVNVDGGVIFDHLAAGTYYAVEVSDESGYVVGQDSGYIANKHAAKIVVKGGATGGVYADAGTDNDDISVMRSIGRLVDTMERFAVDDDVDSTLHDVVATPQLWVGGAWQDVKGAGGLHLKFDDKVQDGVLDYLPAAENESMFYTVETGMPRLRVNQCQEHTTTPRQELGRNEDLTNLFTGLTVVRVKNRQIGSLKISKTVTVADGAKLPASEQDRKFKFTVTLTPAENTSESPDIKLPIAETYPAIYKTADNSVDSDTGDDSVTNGSITFAIAPDTGVGTATVLLGDGQYIVIEGIPVGATYQVEEELVEGYETTPELPAQGTIAPDTKPAIPGKLNPATAEGWEPGAKVAVTNTYTILAVSSLPLTGGGTTTRTYLLIGGGVLLVAGAAWLLARRRRV